MHHTSIIPIEGSRGCHWNKCKFCYLNIGYQYRVKSIDKICTEIEYMIKKYGIYQFQFFDNDFIGLDIQKTNLLLNSLIDIKTKHPNFKIEIIEVITKGLNSSIIKKIIDAGVKYVQIGYESPSDKLLKKINKKNSFASNLFFVKIADLYGMLLGSVNLIINLPEETTEDILEAIENLYFLRFFLKDPQFKHFILPLEVSSSSKYYPIIKKEAKWWSFSVPAYIFLKDLVDTKYHWDIFSYTKHSQNYQWHAFKGIEKFFIDNKYSYSINKNDAVYFYNEYINGRKISEIIFNQDSIDWLILYYSNDKVISLLDLFKIIKGRVAFNKINIDTLQKTIKNLKKQGLLYHSPDFSEVVTVINIPME